MRKFLVLLFCGFVMLAGGGRVSVAKVNTPSAPVPMRLVNDRAGLFTRSQQLQLENALRGFEQKTSTQIAVVTLPDLDGYTPQEMASGIIDNWGVGQKGLDNGVVLLLKPRNDTRGEVFIATGSGMEGVLPDGKVGRIIDAVMLEELKRGDYFTAAVNGVRVIMEVSAGEYSIDDVEDRGIGWRAFVFPGLILLVFIIACIAKGGVGEGLTFMLWLLMILARSGGRGGGGSFGGGGSSGGGAGRSF